MNAKKVKILRKQIRIEQEAILVKKQQANPFDKDLFETENKNKTEYKTLNKKGTIQCTGVRSDYKLLKKNN